MATKKKAKTEVKVDDVTSREMPKNTKTPKLTIVAPEQYEIDWDKIAANVKEAAEEYERKKLVEAAPYHPGYEGAIIETKPVKSKKKKK